MKKTTMQAGEIGPVIVKEKNITDHLIDDTRSGAGPCFWYKMDVIRNGIQVPKTEDMNLRETPPKGVHADYTVFMSTLEPGDEAQFSVPVSECYDMTQPGDYQITFIWERTEPDNPNKIIQIKSNTITITVLPAEEKKPTE
jgi:hypothetical protein